VALSESARQQRGQGGCDAAEVPGVAQGDGRREVRARARARAAQRAAHTTSRSLPRAARFAHKHVRVAHTSRRSRARPHLVPGAPHTHALFLCSIFSRPLSVPKFRHMARYFPHAHHGFDKQGQPIYIDRTGLLDVESVLEQVSKEEVLHSHIIMMEYQNRILMAEGSRRVGHTVHRMCNIVDMTGCARALCCAVRSVWLQLRVRADALAASRRVYSLRHGTQQQRVDAHGLAQGTLHACTHARSLHARSDAC
jgi:hypothetical protein